MGIKGTGFCIGLCTGALAHVVVFGILGGPFLFPLLVGQCIGSGLLTIIITSILQKRQAERDEIRPPRSGYELGLYE